MEVRTIDKQNGDVAVAPAFLSMMSHELTQPLTAALGSAYTLKARFADPELDDVTRAQLFETVIRNLEQLQSLIDRLRVFGDAETGDLRTDREAVAIERIFSDAGEDFGEPASGTTISFESDPGITVDVDLTLFRQVLYNVINNAAKFSPEGSAITVTAARGESDRAVITFADQGPGFPPDEAERIFGKSVRLQPVKKGLGVGLFVAKAIIQAHGGRIWAENTEDGARFSFTVPLASNG